VRYLERELEKRMKLGKAVAVAGLAVALTTSTVGCDELFDGLRPTGGDPLPPEGYDQPAGGIEAPTTGDIVEAGEIPVPDEGTDEGELGGEPLPNDNYEIEGDMPG
jgi:hypothetical protein